MTADQGDEPESAVHHSSRGHLAWALPTALGVILFCAFIGLLRWCGDGQAETCSDPVRTQVLYGDAVRWIVAGALIGGGILALAPWSRVRERLFVGLGVAAAAIGAGLLYLAL